MSPTLFVLLLLIPLSSPALSRKSKMALAQLRGMRHETQELLESITDEEQLDLVEAILDREEEDEEQNKVNTEPLMITTTDLDDTSRTVLGRLRELKDDEKKILKELKNAIDVKEITVRLLKEEISNLESQERIMKKKAVSFMDNR